MRRLLALALLLATSADLSIRVRSRHDAVEGNLHTGGCYITVYDSGTTRLGAIFFDDSGTPLPNPFVADWRGHYRFFAAPGRYDVLFRCK